MRRMVKKIRSSLRSHRWILNRRILPNVWQPGFGTAVGVPLRERYSIGEDGRIPNSLFGHAAFKTLDMERQKNTHRINIPKGIKGRSSFFKFRVEAI